MWTAIGVTVLFIIICGVVECKSCPKRKWLCYGASENCHATSEDTPGETGAYGQLKQSPTCQPPTDDVVNTVIKDK